MRNRPGRAVTVTVTLARWGAPVWALSATAITAAMVSGMAMTTAQNSGRVVGGLRGLVCLLVESGGLCAIASLFPCSRLPVQSQAHRVTLAVKGLSSDINV